MNKGHFYLEVHTPEEVFVLNFLEKNDVRFIEDIWIKTQYPIKNIMDHIESIYGRYLILSSNNYRVFKIGSKLIAIALYPYANKFHVMSNDRKLIEKLKNLIGRDKIKEFSESLPIELYYDANNMVDYVTILMDDKFIHDNMDFNLFRLAGIDPDLLTKEFLESSDTMLLLLGEPGLGKSKLALSIAYLARKHGYPVSLSYLKSQKMLEKVTTRPDLFFSYNRYDAKIFVFDDIDFTVLKRGSDPSIDSFVSFILSITDGVVPQFNKFIITTNQRIKHIDPAFLRPGRLFAAIELKHITYDELAEYDKDLADHCKSYYQRDSFTLADINKVRMLLKLQQNSEYSFDLKGTVVKLHNPSLGFSL